VRPVDSAPRRSSWDGGPPEASAIFKETMMSDADMPASTAGGEGGAVNGAPIRLQ
jgi:hypothetical protein